MRKYTVVVAVVLLAVLGQVAPASAHSEFEPSTAAPGSVITLTLNLENEQSDAGTTRVDLRFPEGQTLQVTELPAADGWTAATEGGNAVPGPATGVVWTRSATSANPDENPELPVRLGPLPASAGRLQFKVLQTYGNGEVDRWIEDWPSGAPEPDRPGPVLDLVAGGPGEVPPTSAGSSTTVTTSASTDAASSTSTTSASTTDGADDDEGGGVPVVLVVIAAVLVIGGAAAALVARRRRPTP